MTGNFVSAAQPPPAPPAPVLRHDSNPPDKRGAFAAQLAHHTGKEKTDDTEKKEKTTLDGTAAVQPPLPPEIALMGQSGSISLPNAGKTTGKKDAMDTGPASPLPAKKNLASELFSNTRRVKPQSTLQSQTLKTDTNTRVQQAVNDVLNPPISTHALAAPMPLKERAQMVRQITEEIGTIRTQALPGGQGRMTLQLHPKEWGKLEVSVTLTPTQGADGAKGNTVVAHIAAENPLVKAALDANPGELRRAMREAGMTLESLTVSVQSLDKVAQPGSASGSHLSQDNGQGGFSQHSQHQSLANPPTADRGIGSGQPSFTSFTGQPQNQSQGGQPPTADSAPRPSEILVPDAPTTMTSQAAAGHLDMRV